MNMKKQHKKLLFLILTCFPSTAGLRAGTLTSSLYCPYSCLEVNEEANKEIPSFDSFLCLNFPTFTKNSTQFLSFYQLEFFPKNYFKTQEYVFFKTGNDPPVA